jgi:hypothetical protein
MWYQDTASSRMNAAKRIGDALVAEAEANRLAALEESGEIHLAVSGRHFHFGSLVIILGRTIREDGHRCADGVRA